MELLTAIRKEFTPIIIVVDLLIVWSILVLTGQPIPPNIDTLVTAVVMFYFGARTGEAAAARALNGHYRDQATQGGSNGTSQVTTH